MVVYWTILVRELFFFSHLINLLYLILLVKWSKWILKSPARKTRKVSSAPEGAAVPKALKNRNALRRYLNQMRPLQNMKSQSHQRLQTRQRLKKSQRQLKKNRGQIAKNQRDLQLLLLVRQLKYPKIKLSTVALDGSQQNLFRPERQMEC